MRLCVSLVVSLLVACGTAATSAPRPAAARPPPRPELVVVVVYDQLGSTTFERELPHLDPDGAIRRTIAHGTLVPRVEYAYAATLTAPGHAAIHSGAAPRDSNIGSNRVLTKTRGRVSSLDDGEHPTHGHEGAFASPSRLRAETVADVIQRETPAAIVASVAMKDRSAILPGGQHPDHCYWFDVAAAGMTTSDWYEPELPAWVRTFHEQHPVAQVVAEPWTRVDVAALESRLGPDDRTGEGAYGFDATFPHEVTDLANSDAFLSHPGAVALQIAFAEALIAETGMGSDGTTDFLSLSIASTDYVGHGFGPDSHEYADMLFRADRAVGELVARLERRGIDVAVLITSDHGAAPLPERSHEHGHQDAVRVVTEVELPLLREHLARLAREASPGENEELSAALIGWAQPYVYFDPDADPAVRQRAIAATREWLRARPGIVDALDARAIGAAELPEDAVLALGIPREPTGDLYVLTREWSPAIEDIEPAGVGTSHGSPAPHDRLVPVIFTSPTRREIGETVQQCRVAGTIAMLAGVDRPEHACPAIE